MWTILRDLLRHNRGFFAGTCLLGFVLAIAALSFVSPYSPLDSYVVVPDLAPGWPHVLGTTSRGQDVFWLLTFAIRNTLAFGLLVALISRLLSLAIGLVSGYAGGWGDRVLMSINDTFIVIPLFPILVLFYFVMTETGGPAWRQTIFHPFAQMSHFGRGRVLRAEIDSPTYAANYYDPRGTADLYFPLPAVPFLKLAAVEDPETGVVTLFALNRHLEQPMTLQVTLPGFGTPTSIDARQLRHPNLKATNTRDKPNRVSPAPLKEVTAGADRVQATLAPASWNTIRLARQR